MKKFIALVLSLIMALSLCAPAWGASVDEAALKAVAANGGSVTLDQHITLTETLNIAAGKSVTIDLNGFSISGDYSTVGAYLITVANTGELTVKDSSNPSTGKISHNNLTGPTRVTGDTVYLEGVFNLQSGTIEQNGYWSTSFVVDVHPNAWGADYTAATVFNMSGGKVTNSGQADSCVRLASTSADGGAHPVYKGVSAVFNMTAGEIVAVRDAVFIQQSNEAYDVLNVNISGGTLSGGNSVIRLYGPAPTSFVSGTETPMTLALTGGTYTYTGSGSSYEPVIDGMLVAAGGASAATFVENMDFTVNKAFVEGMSEEFVLIDNGGEIYSVYATLAEAVAAANTGDTITLLGDVTVDETLVLNNVTLDGAGYTLTSTVSSNSLNDSIRGDGNAKMSAIFSTAGCTIKDLTIVGGWKGVCIDRTATVDTLLDNVTILNSARGINFNDVESNAKLTVKDSTLSGWSGVEGNGVIAFENTTFKKNDSTRGSGLDPYGAITLTNCTFETGTVLTAEDIPAGKVIAISNGIYNGELKVVDGKGTFSITGGTFSADPKAYVVDGYAATEVEGKYVVTVKKAETNKVETEVKVDVVAPSVEVPVIDTSDMTEKDKTLVENVANSLKEDGVKFDDTALVDAAAEAKTAVKNEVTDEEAADLLAEENIPVASDDKVSVVVQPYYDVKVESITVDENGAASVALDITPMYQTVVTTAAANEEIVTKDTAEVGEEVNAVAVGTPKEMTVTKPVTIKIAIPSTLAIADGDGFKPLYVTHTKEETGVKFVYVATVEKDGSDYTATFVNPNGFSSFTLSTTNSAVAYVKDSDTSYATIESAISDAGKGAVIEVLVSDQVVNITAPCSFKLKWADNITEPTFNVAKGYTMSKWYVNGVYTYIVQSASAGGYAPVAPSTPEKVVTSADTFDAGIALYVGMSVMAAAGSAVVLKKRED